MFNVISTYSQREDVARGGVGCARAHVGAGAGVDAAGAADVVDVVGAAGGGGAWGWAS